MVKGPFNCWLYTINRCDFDFSIRGDSIEFQNTVIILLLFFSGILILLSVIAKRKATKLKMEHKIQDGTITYSDLNEPAKPFFSKRYRVAGKPDYIVKRNNRYIPVEVKSGTYNKPQKNHVLQLASYCHLLEENYRSFVPYGILVYNNINQYKIPFDPKTRFELEKTINDMRQALKSSKIMRNHNDYYKCKNCSMRTYCNIKLA